LIGLSGSFERLVSALPANPISEVAAPAVIEAGLANELVVLAVRVPCSLGDVGPGRLDRLSTVDVADANRGGLGFAVMIKVVWPDDRIFMSCRSRIGSYNNDVTEPHFYGRAMLFEQPIYLGLEVDFGGCLVAAMAAEIAAVDVYGL
jgi:hypothetical protein